MVEFYSSLHHVLIVIILFASSRYVEDVFPGNHTSVWGSYMDLKSMRWGFSCCHSLIRGSYCTGSAGQEANDAANTPLAVDASQLRNVMAPPPPPISTDEVKTIPRKDQHDSTKPHRGSEVHLYVCTNNCGIIVTMSCVEIIEILTYRHIVILFFVSILMAGLWRKSQPYT